MGESRWIVLIDKTPRGPLTQSEVRTLIEQKIVRVNDLASRIAPAPEGKKAEWKFLWQYPEFDRRTKGERKASDGNENRRNDKPQEKLEEEKKHLLPEELANIHPEDLSYHSTAHPVHEHHQPQSFEHSNFEEPSPNSFTQPKSFNWGAFAIIPVMLLAGIFAFKLTNKNGELPKSKAKPEMELPTFGVKGDPEYEREVSSTSAPESNPLSGAQPKAATRTAPPRRDERREAAPLVEAPSRKGAASEDSGDISYEEYKRRQEEQIEKDKTDDDDRLRADEGDEEEEVRRPKKKVSAKKRKAASAEEDEEEQQDPLEETLDEEHRTE